MKIEVSESIVPPDITGHAMVIMLSMIIIIIIIIII